MSDSRLFGFLKNCQKIRRVDLLLHYNRVVLMGSVETSLEVQRFDGLMWGYFILKVNAVSSSLTVDYFPICLNTEFCEKYMWRLKKHCSILIEGRIQKNKFLTGAQYKSKKESRFSPFLEIYAEHIDLYDELMTSVK